MDLVEPSCQAADITVWCHRHFLISDASVQAGTQVQQSSGDETLNRVRGEAGAADRPTVEADRRLDYGLVSHSTGTHRGLTGRVAFWD